MTVSGTVQVPVVPVTFTPATAPAPPGAAALDAILFSGPNPTGTVTQYYDEVSYGLLNLTGTVFAATALPQPDSFYEGANFGLSSPGTGQLMQDALNLIDPSVDFGQFDNDGPDGMPNSGDDDGFVDLISFLQPQRGAECNPANGNIWSHRWAYASWFGSAYTTNDPAAGGGSIRIDDYNIQGALDCNNNPMDIGTFAHETGHIFGIPDLYDTDGSCNGIGNWSLMASGSWNTQQSPAHMSAWEKAELGWLVPTLLTGPTNNLSIPEVETNPVAYQIAVGNGEYFLIENRQPVGFDQNLLTCGLAQYEAVHQLLTGAGRDLYGDGVNGNEPGEIAPSAIGWDPARHRVIYLMTDASFHDSDTEAYPTGTTTPPVPVLEAEGRSSVRAQIASLMSSGVGMTVFTLVAEHPGVYLSSGQDGSLPDIPVSEMVEQASELTDMTGGGVLYVGPDNSGLGDAMEVSIEVLNRKTLLPRDMVDWGTHVTLPYGEPDPKSDFEVTRDGAAIILSGNSWRRTVRTYDITKKTVLEFEFLSTYEGELHAIGFDENQKPGDKPRFFQFFGDGDWPGNGAVRDFDQKYTGDGKFQKFVIEVGRYYNGKDMSLVVVSSGHKRTNGTFRNVRLVEQEP